MYKVFWATLACLFLAMPVKANEAARQVITSQIEAFLEDDFATAFEFASPAIRQIFRTPERFGQMVRQGFPMVWRPADVDFLSAEERGGELVQSVLITDAEGAIFVLEYQMIETGEGWLINRVSLRAPEENLAQLYLPF